MSAEDLVVKRVKIITALTLAIIVIPTTVREGVLFFV